MAAHKVLIVDDQPMDLMVLENVIAKAGCEIHTASSGEEAIEQAKSQKPDLIFMDIVMEGMDGYSACREIMQNPETQHIPIIFVSSKNQKVDQIWAKKQGGRALIGKPFKEEQILEQLAQY